MRWAVARAVSPCAPTRIPASSSSMRPAAVSASDQREIGGQLGDRPPLASPRCQEASDTQLACRLACARPAQEVVVTAGGAVTVPPTSTWTTSINEFTLGAALSARIGAVQAARDRRLQRSRVERVAAVDEDRGRPGHADGGRQVGVVDEPFDDDGVEPAAVDRLPQPRHCQPPVWAARDGEHVDPHHRYRKPSPALEGQALC